MKRFGNPLDKKDLAQGEIILPRSKTAEIVGFNYMENHSCGIIEDEDGDFYCVSHGEICRENFNNLPDMPHFDEFEKYGFKLKRK